MSGTQMRLILLIALMAGGDPAWAQDFFPGVSPPGRPVPEGPGGPNLPGQARLSPPGMSLGPPAGSTGSAPLGQDFQYQNWPAPAGTPLIRAESPAPVLAQPLTESTWYTRVDYFHWNERLEGADFVNEDGALLTLGYVRRIGPERFRAELFGGSIRYDGSAQFEGGSSEPLRSSTGYLGVRGEYDLLMEPDWCPTLSFLAGIGTRFWVRDLKNGATDWGNPVIGYRETWWTIYPYLGLEKRRVLRDGFEFYGGGRIGLTALTYQHVSLDDVVLYPKAGIMGQLEGGLRSRRFFLAAFFEAMTWEQSDAVRDWLQQDALQPASRLLTVGLKTGFSF